jgi:hypothetical protein
LGISDKIAGVTAMDSQSVQKYCRIRPTDEALRIESKLEIQIPQIIASPTQSTGDIREAFSVVTYTELHSSIAQLRSQRVPSFVELTQPRSFELSARTYAWLVVWVRTSRIPGQREYRLRVSFGHTLD